MGRSASYREGIDFVGVIVVPEPGDNYTADTRKGVAVEYVTRSA